MAVLAGSVLAQIRTALDPRWRSWVVAAAFVVAAIDLAAYRWLMPFPMRAMTHDPIYQEIARDPRDVVVLEVPVGVRTGTDVRAG